MLLLIRQWSHGSYKKHLVTFREGRDDKSNAPFPARLHLSSHHVTWAGRQTSRDTNRAAKTWFRTVVYRCTYRGGNVSAVSALESPAVRNAASEISGRLLRLRRHEERCRWSFLPAAMKLQNSSLWPLCSTSPTLCTRPFWICEFMTVNLKWRCEEIQT